MVVFLMILLWPLAVRSEELDLRGDGPLPGTESSVRLLAEQGEANAQWLLAHERSTVRTEADDAAALRWLRRAADQGHALAQRDVGMRYELGQGVARDIPEAFFWYSLSSRRESGRAAVQRDALLPRLTPRQLDAVNERLRLWRAVPE